MRWLITSVFIIVFTLLPALSVSCGPDDGNGTVLPQDTVRITGVVQDDGTQLDPGSSPQTYEGAKIKIFEAVEAGRYRLSADAPEQIDYESGEMVAEIASGKDGCWQADLEPGMYFVRAFYGDASYSDDVLVKIEAGEKTRLDLKLIHGL